jgi:GT2 family glycosyltransferase
MKKSISVVIPNYNGAELLKKCLPAALNALKVSGVPYEIIISDDASTDDSVKIIKTHYPEVKLIESQENLGFSKNINKGLRAAKMDLVLALNNDVELDEDYFAPQLEHFKDPKLFGVVGAMYDAGHGGLIDAAKICRQNFWGDIDPTKNIITEPPKPIASFYLSGANALMDRTKLEEINYFNEAYSPFYREDTDLGVFAWRMGWRCLFEPNARCRHKTASTISKHNRNSFIKIISKRNKLIFQYIHLSGVKRVLFCFITIVNIFTRILALDFIFYKSVYLFLVNLDEIKKSMRDRPKPLLSLDAVIKKVAALQKADNIRVF